ncbi:MAG: ABC transporter substrate-binding protein [Gammaproteobacteria bacterium]
MRLWRLVVLVSALLTFPGVHAPAWADDHPFRILHVMSYHQDWIWNRDQFEGFKAALKGVDAEYRVIELDTKRNSDETNILRKADQARALIDSWKPDLLYVNDDNAQKYVGQHYVGSPMPIVFSAVNRDPSEYDYVGAANVTGVLEHEHFIPTVRLLRRLAPEVRDIAVIVDADPTWKGVMSRMRSRARDMPEITLSRWALVHTFEEFKTEVTALQSSADAIAMLGIFNLKDASGADVDYETVLRWTEEHSGLPDFSFWRSRIERGTLCAVTVSGLQQGRAAGEMARRILTEGVTPASIPMVPTQTGEPMINLARARALDLMPPVDLLLDTTVIKDSTLNR